MTAPLEFGLDTFGDVTKDATGALLPHAQVKMLPGVGHTPQVEATDVVVDAIVELCD